MPGVKCTEPMGAFYCFPDVSAYNGKSTPDGKVITSDLDLWDYLITEGRVALVPGSAFFAPGFVRLSYATSQANIEKGLARIGEALAKLKYDSTLLPKIPAPGFPRETLAPGRLLHPVLQLRGLLMYSVAFNARLRSVSDKFDVGYHGNGGVGLIHGDQEVRPLFVAVGLM